MLTFIRCQEQFEILYSSFHILHTDMTRKRSRHFYHETHALFFAAYNSTTDYCSPYAEISVAAGISFVIICVFFTFEQSSVHVRLHENMPTEEHPFRAARNRSRMCSADGHTLSDCRSIKRHKTYDIPAATKFTRIGSR